MSIPYNIPRSRPKTDPTRFPVSAWARLALEEIYSVNEPKKKKPFSPGIRVWDCHVYRSQPECLLNVFAHVPFKVPMLPKTFLNVEIVIRVIVATHQSTLIALVGRKKNHKPTWLSSGEDAETTAGYAISKPGKSEFSTVGSLQTKEVERGRSLQRGNVGVRGLWRGKCGPGNGRVMLRSMRRVEWHQQGCRRRSPRGKRKTRQCFVDGNDSTIAKGRDAEAKAKAIGFDLQKVVLSHSTL